MKEIIIALVLTGIAIMTSLVLLVTGFLRKKRRMILLSLAMLLLSLCSALGMAYWLTSKSYRGLIGIFKPRAGIEIYTALFGPPVENCVAVLNYQDQIIPKLDYAIWLHFRVCPDELKRILNVHNYSVAIISTRHWNTTGPLANNNWFKPETLGDSIILFSYNKDEYGNAQYLYSSLDSTSVFCKDVAD
jgi:hypothetical protein